VSIYLDASVLLALFTVDPLTHRADAVLRQDQRVLIVSDFAAAEFASAIARRVRMKQIADDDARSVFVTFDAWTARDTSRVQTTSADVAATAAVLRRLDLTLRTADALNLAIAQRIAADLLTFDEKMAESAGALGMNVLRG
jgi:predicted nucleic acid-binding protein